MSTVFLTNPDPITFFPRTTQRFLSRTNRLHPRGSLICSYHSKSGPAKTPNSSAENQLRPPRHLIQFRRSRFVAHFNELQRRRLLPDGVVPDPPTRLSAALAEAGVAHEERVVAHLKSLIADPAPLYTVPFGHHRRHDLTQAAILRRVPLIRGAALRNDVLDGYADLLIRSDLDPFLPPTVRATAHPLAYSVCEVKLAAHRNADHILQASVYFVLLDGLLRSLQAPGTSRAYLWLGDAYATPTCLSPRPLGYLFRSTSHNFARFLHDFSPQHTPAPDGPLSAMAPWSIHAENLLRDADSLRLIAGIRRSQALTIGEVAKVSTLTAFARMPSKTVSYLVNRRVLPPATRRLHHQAVMQLRTRMDPQQITAFELTTDMVRSLPVASPDDIFFDMEGFPLAPGGGLEYLFGAYCVATQSFFAWWAHSHPQEEEAFVRFIDWLSARFKSDQPVKPHVFHYGHYEVSALRRVALRAVTPKGMRAAMIFESLVEQGSFFDVYKFVKSGLVIGESSYSIKKVEKLVGISRAGDNLADAQSSVGIYYEWRRRCFDESQPEATGTAANESTHPILLEIYTYNRQDCDSLYRVVKWLRQHFPEQTVDSNVNCDRGDDTADGLENLESEILPGACGRTKELRIIDSQAIARSAELSDILFRIGYPSLSPFGAQCLAHILQFYVRESAPERRLFRDRVEIASTSRFEDLYDDEKCLIGVQYMGTVVDPDNQRKSLLIYSFNRDQPVSLIKGERVAFIVPSRGSPMLNERMNEKGNISGFFVVKSIDEHKGKGFVYLSCGSKNLFNPLSFGVLVSSDDLTICDAPLRQSVLRKAEELIKSESVRTGSLATAFLNRETILENEIDDAAWIRVFSTGAVNCETISKFLASRKKSRVFVIQGPPGTGKTSLSGSLINELIMRHDKTIAITSNSHAAIDNLLKSAVRAGVNADLVWKIGTKTGDDVGIGFKANIRDITVQPLTKCLQDEHRKRWETQNNCKDGFKDASKPKRSNFAVLVGATCYQLCRKENDDKFDLLFIDEASQVPMAHFLSVSASAKYAVLVGDQQQLEMPIKGSHFGAVGQSCLSHMAGKGVATVEPSRGIFLNKSYRMNAALCEFVSEAFYNGALTAAPSCQDNGVSVFDGVSNTAQWYSGIWFIPCETAKDTKEKKASTGKWQRAEEVEVIRRVVISLLGATCTLQQNSRQLREADFLIVAPYNAQVFALRAALPPGVRVGTVDKFQGQEAPIALISTCTSGDLTLQDNDFVAGESDLTDEDDSFNNINIRDSTSRPRDQRGMRFCLHKNRLNVAISRAQCLAIVTGDKDACGNLAFNRLEDIEMAALYEHLISIGTDTTENK